MGVSLWIKSDFEGRKRRYDSVIGLSGGVVDSSFLALEAARVGLRPLIVHVDAGWNSELAVSNIEAVLTATGFDLRTLVTMTGRRCAISN